MNNSEQDTYQKRLEILKKLIKKEFPSEKIAFKDGGIISVSSTNSITEKGRSPRIDFNPDYDFMTDSDSNYEEVFSNGVQIAKQKLEDPTFNIGISKAKFFWITKAQSLKQGKKVRILYNLALQRGSTDNAGSSVGAADQKFKLGPF